MNNDTPTEENWTQNLANLAKAIEPFLPKFRDLRKVCDRLLGDVTETAFDALISRLRLYKTRNQAEAIGLVSYRASSSTTRSSRRCAARRAWLGATCEATSPATAPGPPDARRQPVLASQAAIFVMSANTGPGVARAPMSA